MKNSLKRLLAGVMSSLMLTLLSCSLVDQKKPITIVLLKDTSLSGQNNDEFQTTTKKTWKVITQAIARGDQCKVMQVNGEPDLYENLTP
ncbi:MAG: hypothetical protein ACKN87_20930, partial [Microcystis aeruginosa]